MAKKVYEEIIKQIGLSNRKKEIQEIYDTKIPQNINKWIKEYTKYGDRQEFIWKWLFKVNCIWFYSKVNKNCKDSLVEAKTLYNMFIVLLDDIAEEKGRKDFLDKLMSIPRKDGFYNVSIIKPEDAKYYKFAHKVWRRIVNLTTKFPNYNQLKDVFEYDTSQFLNAVRYANMIFREPQFLNDKEFWLYLPHSMQILVDFDMDMMCHPKLDLDKIGKMRSMALILQEMGRIGNWLSTWEREVMVNDYTSAVVAYAFEDNIISYDVISKNNKHKIVDIIKKSHVERRLLDEWEKRYHKLTRLSKNSKLIKSKDILRLSKYLLYMHLISVGYK